MLVGRHADGDDEIPFISPTVLSAQTFRTFLREFSPFSLVAIQDSSPELQGVRFPGSVAAGGSTPDASIVHDTWGRTHRIMQFPALC